MVSCSDIKSPDIEQESLPETGQEEVWLCYHPDTAYHNKLCVEDYYPNGCYVQGDSGKFCWRLYDDDCKKDIKEEWLFNACNFLGGHN